jgi:serine protease AprX
MNKTYLLASVLLLLLISPEIVAQNAPRYLIYFKDKANSPFSIDRPEAFLSERSIQRRQRQSIAITTTDLPVNPAYVQAVRQTGARVLFTSRWMNAALLEATDTQLSAIRALPFYQGTERNLPLATPTTAGMARISAEQQKFGTQETVDYGRMQTQLNLLGVPALQERGFKGQGMLIALLDAGYTRADQLTYLKHLYDNNRVLDTYDFISRETDVYDDHHHGLNCLSTIAAYQPGTMVGAAYEASFALYRTENEFSETPYEEATWILGAERADSLGADIISCSLGYSQFQNPVYDYSYQDLDGKTALVTRAALHAARKGIVVVVSAGNEGDDPWLYITPPADADSVLAVGATFSNRSYAPFSSIGPTVDGRIKPDVAAVGVGTVIGNQVGTGSVSTGNGTSFACPQIAGLAAILWQANPYLTAQQLLQSIRKAGHLAANPNNLLGYGVPTAEQATTIIQQDFPALGLEPIGLSSVELFPNPTTDALYLRFGTSLLGQTANISLLTTGGAVLSQRDVATEPLVRIPISTLPSGMYFVKVGMGKSVKVLKFIKY